MSDALSLYTVVRSIATATSNQQITTSPSTLATSTSSSSTSDSSSSITSTVFSLSSAVTSHLSSSTTNSAAAASTTAQSSNEHHGISGTTLAIILGCVLGALALGLFILVLLLCCRRKKTIKTGILTCQTLRLKAGETERRTMEAEMLQSQELGSGLGLEPVFLHPSTIIIITMLTTEPEQQMLLNTQPTRNSNEQNPFVPVPPPPRRSTPNSRPGLTDGMVPGQEPFITQKTIGGPLNSHRPSHDEKHSAGTAIAAGAGGAALGAAAMKHHEKSRGSFDEPTRGRPGSITRKPVAPLYTAMNPTHEVTPHGIIPSGGETAFSPDSYTHKGIDNRPVSDISNTPPPGPMSPMSPISPVEPAHYRSGSNQPLMAELAGSEVVGVAASSHYNHKRRSHNNSPKRRSFGRERAFPITSTSTTTTTSTSSQPRTISTATPPMSTPPIAPKYDVPHPHDAGIYHRHSGELPPDYDFSKDPTIANTLSAPPVPPMPPMPAQDTRRRSSSISPDPLATTAVAAPAAAALAHNGHRRGVTPPRVPSRSPRRAHFSPDPIASDPVQTAQPLRKSHDRPREFPDAMPHSSSSGSGVSNTASNSYSNSGSGSGSGESTWRLSSGMPGGWRNSGDQARPRMAGPGPGAGGRRRSSADGYGGGLYSAQALAYGPSAYRCDRDAGVALHNRNSSPMARASTAGYPQHQQRLRLADLRDEEAREMMRNRELMMASTQNVVGAPNERFYDKTGFGQYGRGLESGGAPVGQEYGRRSRSNSNQSSRVGTAL